MPGGRSALSPEFPIHIDSAARATELLPRGEIAASAADQGEQALDLGGLLLVRAELPCGREGRLVPPGHRRHVHGDRRRCGAVSGAVGAVPVSGIQGGTQSWRLPLAGFRAAGRMFTDPEAVAFDLGGLRRSEGVEVTGVLGYSALGQWPLALDLSNATVRIGQPARKTAAR